MLIKCKIFWIKYIWSRFHCYFAREGQGIILSIQVKEIFCILQGLLLTERHPWNYCYNATILEFTSFQLNHDLSFPIQFFPKVPWLKCHLKLYFLFLTCNLENKHESKEVCKLAAPYFMPPTTGCPAIAAGWITPADLFYDTMIFTVHWDGGT